MIFAACRRPEEAADLQKVVEPLHNNGNGCRRVHILRLDVNAIGRERTVGHYLTEQWCGSGWNLHNFVGSGFQLHCAAGSGWNLLNFAGSGFKLHCVAGSGLRFVRSNQEFYILFFWIQINNSPLVFLRKLSSNCFFIVINLSTGYRYRLFG